MDKLNKNSNSVFSLHYHLILVVKYRKRIFTNAEIIDSLKSIARDISAAFHVKILSMECDGDHIHLLISTRPSLDMTKYINILKANSSRKLRKEYHDHIQDILFGDALWSPSYYVATTGNVSLPTLINYVNNQP